MRSFIITMLLLTTAMAHAGVLYGSCRGPGAEFSFVGFGDSAANISLTTARLSLVGRPSLVLAETDGFYADSTSSFKLGSSAFHGTLIIKANHSFEVSDSDFKETGECQTNLFEGPLVEASAERVFEGLPYLEQVIQDVNSAAEKQCPGEDPIHHPNIALIGRELLKGYQTETFPFYGRTLVRVHAKFRCLP